MQTRELTVDGVQIIELDGELDLAFSPILRELLAEYTEVKCKALVLDFAAVSYVDSSGLATLIEYVRNAQVFDGKFALANVSTRVRTVLELVRLHEFLPIHHTVADAAAALGPATP
jgi:anti-sigma B factor antagonist